MNHKVTHKNAYKTLTNDSKEITGEWMVSSKRA